LTKKRLTLVARTLRRRSTDAENRLWYYLRGRSFEGAKFSRQFPIGRYVTDFACRAAHLVVELDGGQHSETVDHDRTADIERYGYRIIRFWNNDVLENTEGVLEVIRNELMLGFDRTD
jgi:very-short-patch-repair endonuclease